METLDSIVYNFRGVFKPKVGDTKFTDLMPQLYFESFIYKIGVTMDICKTLDGDIRRLGFANILFVIGDIIDIVCDKLEFDPNYEPDNDDIEFTYARWSDFYIAEALSDQFIRTPDEFYGEDARTVAAWEVYDIGEGGESVRLSKQDTLYAIKDAYIDDITEQCRTEYNENNRLATELFEKLDCCRANIANIKYEDDYREFFIKSITPETYCQQPTETTSTIESYFVYSDMNKLILVLKDVLFNKKGKEVAVVLLALEQLEIINLQKANRTVLYDLLRTEMKISGTDAGINFCLKLDDRRKAEVSKEVLLLKKRLEA